MHPTRFRSTRSYRYVRSLRLPTRVLVSVVASALLLACSVDDARHEALPDGAVIHSTRHALGIPQNGFHSWQERVVFVLSNRARSDPAAEIAATCPTTCTGTYPQVNPVVFNYNLARASRFHATALRKAGSGLQHESVCVLVSNLGSIYPGTCDGSPSCACVGGSSSCFCPLSTPGSSPYCTCPSPGCTSTWGRIALFGVTGSAENAAAGNPDPVVTFAQWVNSTGHRDNLLKSTNRQLGVGHYGSSGSCYSNYWVQGFSAATVAIPAIPGGAHHPRTGSTSTTIKFWANYFHSGGAPQQALVNIDGSCHEMTRERGTNGNGTWLYSGALATAGCRNYYFYFKDANGNVVTYPSSGSFGVGINSSTCADYHGSVRPSLGSGCGVCSTAGDCADGDPCTTDTCAGGSCVNTVISGCCTSAAQCGDGDPCTADSCSSANTCVNAAISGCCTTAAQCNDSDVCTADSCSANTCVNATISGCCTAAAQCNDSNLCTTDSCSANKCVNAAISGCCTTAAQCNDSNVCTADSCNSSNTCVNATIAGCCTTAAQCNDSNVCTADSCNSSNTCVNATISGCCTTAGPCNDNDVCTADSCSANKCVNATISGCCTSNNQCGDGDPCTADSCSANTCVNATISGCCTTAAQCNDSNTCTADACVANTCQYTSVSGCCAKAADCDDSNACTTETCDTSTGTCNYAKVSGCCSKDTDCDDGKLCTADSCVAAACQHTAIGGCCSADGDCDDGSPCTVDACQTNACTYTPVAGCCTVDSQCGDSDPCTVDTCAANACKHGAISGCCSKDTDCDDGNACTVDACSANVCTSAPIAGCCKQDSDCKDTNPCTVDSCDAASGNCSNKATADCCAYDTDCVDSDPCTVDTCDVSSNSCSYARSPGCDFDGGTGGADAGAGVDEAGTQRVAPGPDDLVLEGGCGCEVAAPPRDEPWPLWGLALLGLALLLRRRRV